MAVLVRCPCSSCRYPKRVESLDYDTRVGFNVFACHNCGVWFYAWRNKDGTVGTHEVSPADGVRQLTRLVS